MLRHRIWFWLVAPLVGASADLFYWFAFSDIGTLTGSVVRGVFVGSPILFYERGLLLPRWRDRIRRAATPLFALATLGTYAAMIVVGNMVAGGVLHRAFGLMGST